MEKRNPKDYEIDNFTMDRINTRAIFNELLCRPHGILAQNIYIKTNDKKSFQAMAKHERWQTKQDLKISKLRTKQEIVAWKKNEKLKKN